MRTACSKGHLFPESLRPGRADCAVCHREQERERRRRRGVQPRSRDACPQGHPYPESLRPSGHGCAVCHREAQKRRYHADPERHIAASIAYQREHRDERRAYMRGYLGELRRRRPEVGAAHVAVRVALKTGRLSREPCEVCGSTNVHAHHDDYARPLDVRWLCPLHHKQAHRLLGGSARAAA